jgi:hypothetical protein
MTQKTMVWLTALVVLLVLSFVPSAAPGTEAVVTLSFSAEQSWNYFLQGLQAYQRNDFVVAYEHFNLSWILFERFRGQPDSPFPPGQQFYDDFKAMREYTRQELAYYVEPYPVDIRQQLSEINGRYSQCQSQLAQLQGGSREIRAGGYTPAPRPPKPVPRQFPPPGQQ